MILGRIDMTTVPFISDFSYRDVHVSHKDLTLASELFPHHITLLGHKDKLVEQLAVL